MTLGSPQLLLLPGTQEDMLSPYMNFGLFAGACWDCAHEHTAGPSGSSG